MSEVLTPCSQDASPMTQSVEQKQHKVQPMRLVGRDLDLNAGLIYVWLHKEVASQHRHSHCIQTNPLAHGPHCFRSAPVHVASSHTRNFSLIPAPGLADHTYTAIYLLCIYIYISYSVNYLHIAGPMQPLYEGTNRVVLHPCENGHSVGNMMEQCCQLRRRSFPLFLDHPRSQEPQTCLRMIQRIGAWCFELPSVLVLRYDFPRSLMVAAAIITAWGIALW